MLKMLDSPVGIYYQFRDGYRGSPYRRSDYNSFIAAFLTPLGVEILTGTEETNAMFVVQ